MAFCINSESLEEAPDNGYLVSMDESEFILGDGAHQDARAKLWVIAMAEDFAPNVYLCGHYNDEDGAMMSASLHFENRHDALRYAKGQNQLAIWNCLNEESEIIIDESL